MSDQHRQFEPDDELFSAYIDDALTPDERASVEARLATDPAAQQLLHELRSASQDVQSLPHQSVGRDLSGEIFRRIQATNASPTAAQIVDPSRADTDDLPRLPVFGSKRAWIWAALALAAGLMIMFIQPGGQGPEKLPPAARRAERSLAEAPANRSVGQLAGKSTSVDAFQSTLRDSESVAVVTRSGGEVKTLPSPGDVSGSGQAELAAQGKPALAYAQPNVATLNGVAKRLPVGIGAMDKLASDSDRTRREVELGSEPAQAPAARGGPAPAGQVTTFDGTEKPDLKSESKAAALPAGTIVVHVVAKPDAIQRKVFEQLLAQNNIRIEPAKSNVELNSSSVLKDKVVSEYSFYLRDKPGLAQPADVLLVEAPQATITSCMAALVHDTANFTGIRVDKPFPTHDQSSAESSADGALADDLSRFERGVVPVQQNEVDRLAKNESDKKRIPGFAGAGVIAATSSAEKTEKGDLRSNAPQTVPAPVAAPANPAPEQLASRGRRIESGAKQKQQSESLKVGGGGAGGQLAKDRAAPASTPKFGNDDVPEVAKQPIGTRRVLFVITPESPSASGPPPANPPK